MILQNPKRAIYSVIAILALIFLSVLWAAQAHGQVTQAAFDSLKARLAAAEARQALMDSIINVRGFMAPRWPCSETEQRRPTGNFPSGEYDLYYRNRQFGCAFDPVATKADSAMARVNQLSIQVAAVASKVNDLPSASALDSSTISQFIQREIAKLPAQPLNATVTNLVVRGKLCVVDGTYATDCDWDKSEQIQCRGAAGCAIGFNANLNNAWRQADTPDGTGPGYVVVGVSPDLGFRVCQNQAWAISGYKQYIIAKGKGCFGFDSQANFSIQQCEYGQPCQPGQSMVLLRRRDLDAWVWTAWQRNVYACLQSSLAVYGAADGNLLCAR